MSRHLRMTPTLGPDGRNLFPVRRWRVTRGGRVVLTVLVAALLAAFLAPSPWSDAGALLSGAIVLFGAMGTYVGGTRGGALARTPAPEDERLAVFRQMYRPRRRP